jgi:predicted dehydrogenase
MSGPLRVAVVGTGFGASVHVPGLRSLANVDVVAIVGRDPQRTRSTAAELGIEHAVLDTRTLLEMDLDAVTVAVPPSAVEPVVAPLLDAGLPVLCEKPLGMTHEVAARLAAQAAGQVTGVDFLFAELPSFTEFRDRIRRKDMGDILGVSVLWTVQSLAHRRREWSWKLGAREGGGVTAMLGIHAAFLLEHILGPVSVRGRVAGASINRTLAPAGEAPAPNTIALFGCTESGAPVQVLVSNAAPGGPLHRWEVVCARGIHRLENPTTDYLSGFRLSTTGMADVLPSDTAPGDEAGGAVGAFRSLAQRFLDAVRDKRDFWPDFAAAARAQALLDGKTF